MEGGKPVIVTNTKGQRTTPSVVAYTKNGDRLVGQIAKRQAVVNPENTFFSVKRFIGRKMSEVDEESKLASYTVVRDDNCNVKLDFPAIGKQFTAEEISAQYMVYNTTQSIAHGKLKVHLVPYTHDDVGWLKTINQYYVGSNNSVQGVCVQNVLDSLVPALLVDKNRRFIYVEQAFFQRWWRDQSEATHH